MAFDRVVKASASVTQRNRRRSFRAAGTSLPSKNRGERSVPEPWTRDPVGVGGSLSPSVRLPPAILQRGAQCGGSGSRPLSLLFTAPDVAEGLWATAQRQRRYAA